MEQSRLEVVKRKHYIRSINLGRSTDKQTDRVNNVVCSLNSVAIFTLIRG